jgi:hypothetical protein
MGKNGKAVTCVSTRKATLKKRLRRHLKSLGFHTTDDGTRAPPRGSAMTGFIAYVFFLYPSRVSSQEAFDVLSPDDGKLSRPVLRGPGLTMGSGYSINRLHPVRT